MNDSSPIASLSPTDRVFVMGLGATGRSVVRAACVAGAEVYAWDDNSEALARGVAAFPALRPAPNPAWDNALARSDMLVWSPGIPYSGPEAHPLARVAAGHGLSPISDLEVFLSRNPEMRVAAITGTDGKSTTATLLAEMLVEGGVSAVACGNLGQPVLDAFAEADDSQAPPSILVLEMSSFQIPMTPSLAAEVSVLVSLAPDHLDYHGGLRDYIEAKRGVFRACGRAVVGIDDLLATREHARLVARFASVPVAVSGRIMPTGGVGFADGELCDAEGSVARFPETGPFAAPHNRLNAAAAWAAASALGAPREAVAPVLARFRGLPHRLQHLRDADGIAFVNDSKATTVHAARAALETGDNLFWIAGGQGKSQDFTPLFADLPPSVRAAFVFGEAADDLCAAASRTHARIPVEAHASLEAAFAAAVAAATRFVEQENQPATILLSPACASFDQFENFAARGNAFAALAAALADARIKGAPKP